MSTLPQINDYQPDVLCSSDFEETHQAEAEYWCETYENLILELEVRTPTEGDFRRLAEHEKSCLTGRHSEVAAEDALDLPRGALRRAPADPGAQFRQIAMVLSFPLDVWRESQTASTSNTATSQEDEDSDDLAKNQYSIARRYPGEYVVLLGEEVAAHSKSRQKAFAAYDRAFDKISDVYPVIVEPHLEYDEPPVVRGRSLTAHSSRHR